MAYSYSTRVFLRDSDATGVLYFAEQLRISLEAFESFLADKKVSLGAMVSQADYLMPVVHAEADFFAPLFVGDPLEVSLSLGSLGHTSFGLHYLLLSNGLEVGKALTVHVAVDRIKRAKIPLPEPLIALLKVL